MSTRSSENTKSEKTRYLSYIGNTLKATKPVPAQMRFVNALEGTREYTCRTLVGNTDFSLIRAKRNSVLLVKVTRTTSEWVL